MGTEHQFTKKISEILQKNFPEYFSQIYDKSLLIQYINYKTKSVDKGSKARNSFGNIYSIYILIEDYINKNFNNLPINKYSDDYEGAQFKELLNRQRKLPFGEKLQNHSLNNRTNSEFNKFFPNSFIKPIVHDVEKNRYWINAKLLNIEINGQIFDISNSVIEIIDEYIMLKQDSFKRFIDQCKEMQKIINKDTERIKEFLLGLLAPNVDARLFEIVSYSVLKYYYQGQKIYWGYELENLTQENLKLYKTGRTNANDGGIDFVMKPLGRFFQVTETLDFKKYFLDIDKIQKYPITFVVKSQDDMSSIRTKLERDALNIYCIKSIVDKYLSCIEDVINILTLIEYFNEISIQGLIKNVLDEIILQSSVEFNAN